MNMLKKRIISLFVILVSLSGALVACQSQEVTETASHDLTILEEHPITKIALSGPVASSQAEVSGMAWCGDNLILLPQFPEPYSRSSGKGRKSEEPSAYRSSTVPPVAKGRGGAPAPPCGVAPSGPIKGIIVVTPGRCEGTISWAEGSNSLLRKDSTKPPAHSVRHFSGSCFQAPALHDSVVAYSRPHSPEAEQFRMLKTTILFPDKGVPPRTIMITSSAAGEGKSFVAANLATSMANGIDEYVLLMDCDLRRPHPSPDIWISGQYTGLTEYLTQGAPLAALLKRTGGKTHPFALWYPAPPTRRS